MWVEQGPTRSCPAEKNAIPHPCRIPDDSPILAAGSQLVGSGTATGAGGPGRHAWLDAHCLNQKVTELPSHRVSRQMQPRICGQLTTSVGKANCNASAILVVPYTVPVCGVLLSY